MAAATIGGSPSSTSLAINQHQPHYQHTQFTTQYSQLDLQHPPISSPTQQIPQIQSQLHQQHPSQNHHQLVNNFFIYYLYLVIEYGFRFRKIKIKKVDVFLMESQSFQIESL